MMFEKSGGSSSWGVSPAPGTLGSSAGSSASFEQEARSGRQQRAAWTVRMPRILEKRARRAASVFAQVSRNPAARALGRDRVRDVASIREGEGERERELALGCAARVAPLAGERDRGRRAGAPRRGLLPRAARPAARRRSGASRRPVTRRTWPVSTPSSTSRLSSRTSSGFHIGGSPRVPSTRWKRAIREARVASTRPSESPRCSAAVTHRLSRESAVCSSSSKGRSGGG